MKIPDKRFLTILGANFFFFLNFSQLILMPKYILHIGLTPEDVGFVMGAFSITVLAALPVVGFVSRRISNRALFVTGAGLMCFTTPIYVSACDTHALLYALRIVQGIGFSSAFGISAAMVFDIYGESEQRLHIGILTVCNIITHALGPSLGEYLIIHYGYDAYFWVGACFGIISFVMGFFLPGKAKRLKTSSGSCRRAYPCAAGTTIMGMIFGSVAIFMPPYLETLSIVDSSPFFISFVSGSLLVWFFLHRYMKNLRDASSWMIAVLFFVLLPLCSGCLDKIHMLVVISVLFGAGYGYLYPTLNTIMLRAIPDKTSAANTVFVWSFNLGMLIASVGSGLIIDRWGYRIAFFITGAAGVFLLGLKGRLND